MTSRAGILDEIDSLSRGSRLWTEKEAAINKVAKTLGTTLIPWVEIRDRERKLVYSNPFCSNASIDEQLLMFH